MDGKSLVDSAVSWAFLQEFASKCEDKTVEEIVESIVLPKNKEQCSSFSSSLSTHQVGPATFFVSHSRSTRLSQIVTALRHFLQGSDPNSVFLWFDFFSVSFIAMQNRHLEIMDTGDHTICPHRLTKASYYLLVLQSRTCKISSL